MEGTEILSAVLGALGAIGTVAVTFSKLKDSWNKEIDQKINSSIETARNMAEADIKAFNIRLDSVSRDIQNLEEKVDKDIDHVKAIYNGEIRQLGEKIESLREDVQRQHQQLVGLLTKLITNN